MPLILFKVGNNATFTTRVRGVATGVRGSLGEGGGDGGEENENNANICVYIFKTGNQGRGGGERVVS